MKRNIFVDPEIGNTFKKFTMYFSVFFLAFGFTMIIRNAGDTYAYSQSDCPNNWTYVESKDSCMHNSNFDEGTDEENLQACKDAITGLGLTVDFNGFPEALSSEHNNYCLRADNGIYSGYISPAEYAKINQVYSCYICQQSKTGIWATGQPSESCFSTWQTNSDAETQKQCETKYNVVFDPNGGDMGLYAKELTLFYGEKYYLPVPEKEGEEFKGWCYSTKEMLNVDSCDDSLRLGDRYNTMTNEIGDNLSANHYYFAMYEDIDNNEDVPTDPDANPTEKTFAAEFDANEGTLSGNKNDSCTTTGSSCKITDLPTAKRDGFTFGGWGTSKTCTSGTTGDLTLSSTKTTFYACWSQNQFQVTFDVDSKNGGKLLVDNVVDSLLVRNYLSSIDLDKFKAKKDGFEFNGWSFVKDSCSEFKSGNIPLNDNLTVYACYTEKEEENPNPIPDNKTYTVKFNLDGGNLYKGSAEQKGDTFTLSKFNSSEWTAKKDGFKFKYWSKNKECLKKYAPNGSLNQDLELWACYDPDKTNEEIDTNSKTGSGLLYLVYLICIFALGYTGYSVYNYFDKKKN